MKIKKDDVIYFDLDRWSESGEHKLENVQAKVDYISTDPLGLNEPKCSVTFNNEDYGIPFSCVTEVVAYGQLELF